MADEKNINTQFPALHEAMGIRADKPAVAQVEPAPADETQVPDATPAAPVAEAPKVSVKDMSEEDRLELLKELTGGKISSFDELNPPANKTKEELEKEAQDRKNAALSWAFDSGKLTRESYDKALIEKSKSNRELALSLFTQQLQAEDKDITQEEAEEIFRDTYHEDKDDNSRLRKLGEKQINEIAESYKKANFGSIDTLEDEYDQHVSTVGQYSAYKKTVKSIVKELPAELSFESTVKGPDGNDMPIKFTVPVDESVKNSLINDYSKEGVFAMMQTNGVKDVEKALNGELNYHLKARMFDKVIPQLLANNTKDVMEKMVVFLGNKKHPEATLNGVGAASKAEPKKNNYSGLHQAMASGGVLN